MRTLTIIDKLVKVAENTTKVYDAGYKKAKETFCSPINETGMVVQCCPLEGESFTITDIDDFPGTVTLTICGKNLYNPIKYPLNDGFYISIANGAITATTSGYCATEEYIPVSHLVGKKLFLNYRPGGANPGMMFYNAKKAYISNTGGKGDGIVVPEGAAYMRFTSLIANKTEVQIELGSAGTSSDPYAQTQVTLADHSDLPVEVKPLKGINTIFAYSIAAGDEFATSVTVKGTTDPNAEIERLTNMLTAMGGNIVSTTEEV